MIGSFVFRHSKPEAGGVVIELFVNDAGEACGRVVICPMIVQDIADAGVPVYRQESMRLPFALSHAVAMAAVAECPLWLSGDQAVWPESWGNLDIIQ